MPETPPRATRLDGLIPAYFEMCIKTSAPAWERSSGCSSVPFH